MRNSVLNRIGGIGLADGLKKSVLGLVIAVLAAAGLQAGASAAPISDPMELAGADGYEAPGAHYQCFSIANGDPNEEKNQVWPEHEDDGNRPPGLPAPGYVPPGAGYQGFSVANGDPNEERGGGRMPVERPDYSGFDIGPGDPHEEQNREVPGQLGGSKPLPAPFPAPLLDIQGGDERDQPAPVSDYSGFEIGPGDPNEEGNN